MDNFSCQAAPEFVLDHSHALVPTSISTLKIQYHGRRNWFEHFSYIRQSFVLLLISAWWHKVHLAISKPIILWWREWKLTHRIADHMQGSPYFSEPQFLLHANSLLAKINSDYGSNLNNLCYSFWRRGKYQKIQLTKLRMTWKPEYPFKKQKVCKWKISHQFNIIGS